MAASGGRPAAVAAVVFGMMVLAMGVFVVFMVSMVDSDWDSWMNPPEIYQEPGTPGTDLLLSPFHLHIDPMERLLLLNFEGDPDRVYVGFEPQYFDDPVHGRGLLVIGWRVDGRVDVYHQPGLLLDPATYDIAGEGLAHMVMRPMEGARFEINRRGAQLEVAFQDLEERPVELLVRESSPRPRRTFGLLAPMGAAATAPSALPLVFLNDFYFVRRAGGEVRVRVDGVERRPDRLPLPVDGSRMYFTRYAENPFIVTWNPPREGPLRPLERMSHWDALGDGVTYDLEDNFGRSEIHQMRRSWDGSEAFVEFEPAFPQVTALRDGAQVDGRFWLWSEPWAGTVSGEYHVRREGSRVAIEISPVDGWDPPLEKLSLAFIYRANPVFRTWPASYRWEAELELEGEGGVTMTSRWVRWE